MSSFSHPFDNDGIDSILRNGRQLRHQNNYPNSNFYNNNASTAEMQQQQQIGVNRRQQQQQQQQHQQLEILPPQQQQQQQQQQTKDKLVLGLRPVHRYADLVCIGLSLLAYLLETTLNAALAIFGIGVGVGLVLGDSFRAALPLMPAHNNNNQHRHQTAVQQQQQQQNMMRMMSSGRTVIEEGSQEAGSTNSTNLYPAQ